MPSSSHSAEPDGPSDGELFGATVTVGAYGSTVVDFKMPDDGVRPTAPTERIADAPAAWWTEARATALRIAHDRGYVDADVLREAFPYEPSATGGAIGALFRGLSREGLLVLKGYHPSTRPSSHKRVVGTWVPTYQDPAQRPQRPSA